MTTTKIHVDNRCAPFNSYRAARVKSLFNVEDGHATRFRLDAELPDTDGDWKLGIVVGPSGSGKTSIGRQLWGGDAFYSPDGWRPDAPIVDCIAEGGNFDDVTAALGAVGLGDVPTWLRPYDVLSNGQKFRADLARIIAERPERVVVDEFTSVVDRQVAKVGAQAFAKSWKRGAGKAVLLSCHYDILSWAQPDWIFDTATGELIQEYERRPSLEVEIRRGGWELWPFFKPHHYLDSGPMIGAKTYVAFIDGEPVAHLGMGTKNLAVKGGRQTVEARACRMVTMPEWQGAGVGMRFLNHVCQLQLEGRGVIEGRRMTTIFHTSHPGLCAALRRDRRWRQVSGVLHGGQKSKSRASLNKSQRESGRPTTVSASGFGGHFRAVQGFRYIGEKG